LNSALNTTFAQSTPVTVVRTAPEDHIFPVCKSRPKSRQL
jgi:hypothetical protein